MYWPFYCLGDKQTHFDPTKSSNPCAATSIKSVLLNMITILVSVFALVCVGLVACEYTQDDIDQWEAFKAQYGKTYESLEEEGMRQGIFFNRLEMIREHNLKFERGEVSYTLGVNEFSDRNPDELHTGLRLDGDTESVCDGQFHQTSQEQIPTEVDWRTKGVVTKVKDQKRCGSCWAFSATGALEGQHALKTKKLVSLSEQDLVDCENIGCESGYTPWGAFEYISKHGIDSEESYPYEGVDGKCRFNPKFVAATDKGCRQVPPGDEEALKEAVASVGPISVAVHCLPHEWIAYKSHVYKSSECSSDPNMANHGVLVVGYGTTEEGEDYWLVKNSWGTTFGEEGYIKVARNNNNMCGIANLATYPVV